MRVVEQKQFKLGQVAVGNIQIDPRSRDDIPAILKGLQLIYTNKDSREKLFTLLEQTLDPKVDQRNGRPGMELWNLFVLATLKQGLDCDFDRLQELANRHLTVREMLGHTPWEDETYYAMQTLVDNVSLLKPSILAEISQLVVEAGHKVVKKKAWQRIVRAL